MPTLVSRDFSEAESMTALAISELGEQMMAEIMKLPHSRERSVALTKLEETIMWVNKTINVVGLGDREH